MGAVSKVFFNRKAREVSAKVAKIEAHVNKIPCDHCSSFALLAVFSFFWTFDTAPIWDLPKPDHQASRSAF
jgi:hypothetical protein